MSVVSARNLNKRFGSTRAMDNVHFVVEPGSIVGLIGPNGAGKTTTLKAILGLTGFEGSLSVLGQDPRHGRHQIMKRVRFIADVGVLPRWLKVSDAVKYVGGVHERFDRDKAIALLKETDISPNQRVKQLSKGMVTQLHLALVMSIDVDLLVLDEPTLGLDILYRKTFYERLLNDYFDKNTSIIVSTHQIEEIESLLTHLLFIDRGQIVLDSAMDSLSASYSELLVNREHLDQAMSLQPIHSRDVIGKKCLIFFDTERSILEPFGEVSTPSVTDLFVALLSKE